MADDIQYGDGRTGPAPRRRKMYATPFGMLQTDSPPIQYGNGTGPAPQQQPNGINALAAPPAPAPQPIAQPFGMLPTACPTPDPPAPSVNVEAGTPTPIGWVPPRHGSILGAALTPSRNNLELLDWYNACIEAVGDAFGCEVVDFAATYPGIAPIVTDGPYLPPGFTWTGDGIYVHPVGPSNPLMWVMSSSPLRRG